MFVERISENCYSGTTSNGEIAKIVPSSHRGYFNIEFSNGRKAFYYTMFEIEHYDFEWKFNDRVLDRTGDMRKRGDGSTLFIRDYKKYSDIEIVLFSEDKEDITFFHNMSWSDYENDLYPNGRPGYKKRKSMKEYRDGKKVELSNGGVAEIDYDNYNRCTLRVKDPDTGETKTRSITWRDYEFGRIDKLASKMCDKSTIKIGGKCNLSDGVSCVLLARAGDNCRVLTDSGIRTCSYSDLLL